jgi:Cd2+/Zn2+-exporting ATPase
MKREYFLKNLECPNCANKIETALRKVDGVASAEINFITTTLTLMLNKDVIDITHNVQKVVNQYESDVWVIASADTDKKSKTKVIDEDDRKQTILLIIGAILFVIGVIIKNTLDMSNYIILPILLLSYILLGGKVVLRAIKNITKGQIFDENFLMSIATIGAFIIGDLSEAVAVMLFYQVGEFFQSKAIRKSK